MSITMDTAIATLVTNKRRVSALKSLGVATVGDALTYYPFRVTEPVPLRALCEAQLGSAMAFAATVRDLRVVPMNTRRGFRLEATVDDTDFARSRSLGGSLARLTFFSYRKSYVDWVSMRLKAGTTVVISGVPDEYMGQLQFMHPDLLTVMPTDAAQASPALKYDAATVADALTRVCRPRPVYHASSRISSEHIHETILGLLWMMGARVSSVPEGMGGDETAAAGLNGAAAMQGLAAPDTATIAVQPEESQLAENQAATGIAACDLSRAIPDILPEQIRSSKGLMHRAEAFLAIHDPQSRARFNQAIDTLRYEEAFVAQTALLQARQHAHATSAHPCPLNAQGVQGAQDAGQPGSETSSTGSRTGNLRDRFIALLPFQLTAGQRQVIDDISADMERDWPMQRLLQGEVGSGKTVVALAAMLQAVGAGYQAVLVAPTQVLAEQHAATIRAMIGPEVPVALLTGGMKLAARRKVLAQAASGEAGIIVATHAAFSKTFQAPRLALVVIDEQHRFGVEQRESLNAKAQDGTTPHLLVMTATPIPRTAAMTWFGDLDLSWLTELPGGRKPIRTIVVQENDANTMGRMFAHIRARIDAGERAYVVCPRIDMDDDEGDADGIDSPYDTVDDNGEAPKRPPLHSVEEIAARLAKLPQFQGIAFATLTGRDSDDTKTAVMADFASGITPVLVSTTVIEVGVDVKQASCIVIFDADRYGLSQLHQLRGRVGRGGTNSWAFLISRADENTPASARLEVIHHSLDGAEIAQADLEFRGAGDVLGDAQSGGKSSLKLLRVVKDADMIADARLRAEQLLASDPELSGEVELAGAVLDFMRGNETFLTSS
ncbi:ATP-dependent DNA helicase RecG [Bifidobacterium oedipodis]|uniref:ATP-dependent DNA helicase RecG n=1 Tax=Bifidobacterium oedipodis TaxID=2675322 RepID=A0A7Y0EQI8_9BIFI|nr:ATP-dependent DNA helicase RecG [Bifidobacterium sp. DSM 109957]NMM94525.1 ATP-dependent DNA helicase RecG [Bifidobacterium sp. DSM 109957]